MKPIVAAVFAIVVSLTSGSVHADPTLDTMRATGVFKLGFRMDAKPFAFLDPDGNAAGYAVDLCRRIYEAVKEELGARNLEIEYIPTTASDRLALLKSGKIDIECGSTTRTLERQKEFDFSVLTFVTGAELMVRIGSGISDLQSAAGKKIGVLRGTTTEQGLRDTIRRRGVAIEMITLDRHEEGLASLETGEIDGYLADRALLYGLSQRAIDPSKLKLTGKFYSFEPYALALRRGDDDLRLIADATLARLYRSGTIEKIYGRWFPGAPTSDLLRALYVLQALPEH